LQKRKTREKDPTTPFEGVCFCAWIPDPEAVTFNERFWKVAQNFSCHGHTSQIISHTSNPSAYQHLLEIIVGFS
jgi:hypothetical protein